MTRPLLRLLHTSDVHIGDDGRAERRLEGLRGVVDAALANEVDALLVVGDLFDSARVLPEQVEQTLEQLARLEVPAVVVPGNHDQLESPSIYDRVRLHDAGEHVHFLDDPQGAELRLDAGLRIWNRATYDHSPEFRPLSGYAGDGGGWQVVLAHGHYVPDGEPSHRSSVIRQSEISALGCDYLAMGHWHRYFDASSGGVPAYYCGSPSEEGSSFASANLVTLDPALGVRVERVRLSPVPAQNA
ncbi:MAG: DNA repair exonuclease [Proteobacteria bacterium]|nr:DNA repair exonuclease [Pseudomonadota bacterium]